MADDLIEGKRTFVPIAARHTEQHTAEWQTLSGDRYLHVDIPRSRRVLSRGRRAEEAIELRSRGA
jgi:hypothetical protein